MVLMVNHSFDQFDILWDLSFVLCSWCQSFFLFFRLVAKLDFQILQSAFLRGCEADDWK